MTSERNSGPRAWRNCPECFGSGQRRGPDKVLDGHSYETVEPCPCRYRFAKPPPSGQDAQRRAAGEKEGE